MHRHMSKFSLWQVATRGGMRVALRPDRLSWRLPDCQRTLCCSESIDWACTLGVFSNSNLLRDGRHSGSASDTNLPPRHASVLVARTSGGKQAHARARMSYHIMSLGVKKTVAQWIGDTHARCSNSAKCRYISALCRAREIFEFERVASAFYGPVGVTLCSSWCWVLQRPAWLDFGHANITEAPTNASSDFKS